MPVAPIGGPWGASGGTWVSISSTGGGSGMPSAPVGGPWAGSNGAWVSLPSGSSGMPVAPSGGPWAASGSSWVSCPTSGGGGSGGGGISDVTANDGHTYARCASSSTGGYWSDVGWFASCTVDGNIQTENLRVTSGYLQLG
jgi:hypothetical protein